MLYGTRLKVRLAAKRVPEAVERWIRMYEAERQEGEEFNDYAERVGTTRFEEEVKLLALPIEFSLENMSHFIDWQRKEPFQVIRARANARSRAGGRGDAHPGGRPPPPEAQDGVPSSRRRSRF